jgi:16S rRNA (guanine966-N2)-methyltransferase
LRNRQLPDPSRAVRPTQDKVRQALFSVLRERVVGAGVLDLFAGSGALGLEAWSRGAAAVTWVEKDPGVVATLQETIRALCRDGGAARCVRADVLNFLRTAAGPFEIVLADPPYGSGALLEKVLRTLQARPILSPNGVVVLEQSAREAAPAAPGWSMQGKKTYGETQLLFFQLSDPE